MKEIRPDRLSVTLGESSAFRARSEMPNACRMDREKYLYPRRKSRDFLNGFRMHLEELVKDLFCRRSGICPADDAVRMP